MARSAPVWAVRAKLLAKLQPFVAHGPSAGQAPSELLPEIYHHARGLSPAELRLVLCAYSGHANPRHVTNTIDSSISLQQIQDLLVQLLVGGSRLGTASQLLESAEAIASFVPCQCHAAVEKRPQVISLLDTRSKKGQVKDQFWPAFAERVSRLVASQSLDGPIMARIVGGHLAEPQQLDALQLPEVVALARDAAHLGEPQVRLAAAIGHRVGGPGLSALKLKDH
eukprot:s2515_g3.t4